MTIESTRSRELIQKCQAHIASEPFASLTDASSLLGACALHLGSMLDEIELLRLEINRPDEIQADPAGDFETLQKQFRALLMAFNSKSRQCEHWRRQSGDTVRETLMLHASELHGERDTNEILTNLLEATEAERDALKREREALVKGLLSLTDKSGPAGGETSLTTLQLVAAIKSELDRVARACEVGNPLPEIIRGCTPGR